MKSSVYQRSLAEIITGRMGRGKAIVVTGARQVGKTTLIRTVIGGRDHLFLDCDDPSVRTMLANANTQEIMQMVGHHKLVFIDEAQRVAGIGITLKIITDQLADVHLLVSGSSSFGLGNALNEPLTGRKWEYELFPVSWEEFESRHGYLEAEQQLENRLLYGMYPDVLNHLGEEQEVLKNLVNSYLYRDMLAFSNIRKPEVLDKLVQSLALQVGSEVNFNELSQVVGVDKNTINRYVDILQQGYVVFKLGSFSRNLRNEIKRNKKIYFYDNGVRNMVLGNFNPLDLRPDKGALWENFLVSERMKQHAYKNTMARIYFWRSKQQQEVDFVEEMQGLVTGYEFKFREGKKVRLPKTFTNAYNARSAVVDRGNFRDFVVL